MTYFVCHGEGCWQTGIFVHSATSSLLAHALDRGISCKIHKKRNKIKMHYWKWKKWNELPERIINTHTHTHIYICVCVCVCVCNNFHIEQRYHILIQDSDTLIFGRELVGWFVLLQVKSIFVILYRSHFSNYGFQLYIVLRHTFTIILNW